MLRVDKLDFSYNQQQVLKKIDLYIADREFVGIIGPNGSGKSTLLKNISRIMAPDNGVIYLNQQLLSSYNNSQLARLMAVVPQDTTVDYNFSVYDLVMMGRNPYQDRWGRVSTEDKEIVREFLEMTDTYRLKDKDINQLSGGERQRVIIARALAQKPKILLLDEPTASLDINYQGEIFDLLAELNKDLGLTIMVVSHDLNLSSQYCSKLVLLKEGEIFQIGKPWEVMTPENIREVYQTEVIIKNNHLTDRPYIILIPKVNGAEKKEENKKIRIHLICGGGSGRVLMQDLYYRGYSLSCGVLNQGDSDWELARELDVKMVEIPPFNSMDENSIEKMKDFISKSDLIIVTSTPFGHGNLENLRILLDFSEKKKILINEPEINKRDYTGGLALNYWDKLVLRKNSFLAVKMEQALKLIEEKTSDRI